MTLGKNWSASAVAPGKQTHQRLQPKQSSMTKQMSIQAVEASSLDPFSYMERHFIGPSSSSRGDGKESRFRFSTDVVERRELCDSTNAP